MPQTLDSHTTVSFLKGDVRAYEVTYKQLFKPLFIYAFTMLNDEAKAEGIVQHVFLKLWEKKDTIEIKTSLKAYLYKAVHNSSLNAIKHIQVKQQYESHLTHTMKNEYAETPERSNAGKQLEGRIRHALAELPEQCRTVFQLSRFEDLKYREIAERLSISEKTVENHIGKALKIMRVKLSDYLVSIIAALVIFRAFFVHLLNHFS